MSTEIEDRSDETVYGSPPQRTFVTLEIPGKPTLADLATLLGDNGEFVTDVTHQARIW